MTTAPSFRDPGGTLCRTEAGVFRLVTEEASGTLREFLTSAAGRRLVADGAVVETDWLPRSRWEEVFGDGQLRGRCGGEWGGTAVEHEPVWFPSFPYEWPAEMLHAAGTLTIELARRLLPAGWGIKDATPYNVLFRGAEPVFVDLLSFERRDPRDPFWLAAAQFERTFLLPLLAHNHLGVGLDSVFATRRDGLEPEEVNRWLKAHHKLRPLFLSLVCVPAWLGSLAPGAGIYERRTDDSAEKARFILEALLARLARSLKKLKPRRGRNSPWAGYMTANQHYGKAQLGVKEEFVRRALEELRPARVLDAGCNTGHFSRMAAKAGCEVVSIDADPVVVGELYAKSRGERLDILPLVVNLARPSPATGWLNQECPSFLERAEGQFDMVLLLAVMHHLLVAERIPLEEIIGLAARLTRGYAVIEYVGPQDVMFRKLVRGREHLHADLTEEAFEGALSGKFELVRKWHIEGTGRTLYLLRKFMPLVLPPSSCS